MARNCARGRAGRRPCKYTLTPRPLCDRKLHIIRIGGVLCCNLRALLPLAKSGLHGRSALLAPHLAGNHGNQGGTSHLQSLIPWLAPAWLAGVCLCYIRYAVGWFSTNRLRHSAACHAPAFWQATLSHLGKEVRISRPIMLLESFLADIPMVLGHFRPVILTPLGSVTGLPPNQVEAVLLHELAHIARCDYLANIFQRILEGLLFYYPPRVVDGARCPPRTGTLLRRLGGFLARRRSCLRGRSDRT